MPRPKNQPRQVELQVIIWANIVKWQTIRGVSDDELKLLLGVGRIADRKRSGLITGAEMGRICTLLDIEPEKLLER